jgi:hypothetical protein
MPEKKVKRVGEQKGAGFVGGCVERWPGCNLHDPGISLPSVLSDGVTLPMSQQGVEAYRSFYHCFVSMTGV